jgi:hypothetical protein
MQSSFLQVGEMAPLSPRAIIFIVYEPKEKELLSFTKALIS